VCSDHPAGSGGGKLGIILGGGGAIPIPIGIPIGLVGLANARPTGGPPHPGNPCVGAPGGGPGGREGKVEGGAPGGGPGGPEDIIAIVL
jgi:hypothetical protein